jgi:hypothetical protein
MVLIGKLHCEPFTSKYERISLKTPAEMAVDVVGNDSQAWFLRPNYFKDDLNVQMVDIAVADSFNLRRLFNINFKGKIRR